MNKQELIKNLNKLQSEQGRIQLEIDAIKNQILKLPKETLLEEFNDWYEYSNKLNYRYIISKHEAPIMRGIIDNMYLEKYETVYIDDFIDRIESEEIDDVDGLMQELINLNFGSMVYDW